MDLTRSPGAGSGNSGTYTAEMAESLRFEEEIQSLIHPSFEAPSSTGKNSFTALLGLPPNQAVELLHDPDSGDPARLDAAVANAAFGETRRSRLGDHTALLLPLGSSPTFPTDAGLVERAARFSVFAAEDSPASSSCFGRLSPKPKIEPMDSNASPICPKTGERRQRPAKRKDAEKSSKAKAPAKKSKIAEENTAKAAPAKESSGGGEKLPYVHVRARRGQATDSHSLAERARREKINARMKLLQELVPSCSKISGTALVLDEIINHVRSLQRQVEFLSMILSAVYPRMDLSGADSFSPAERGGRAPQGNGNGNGNGNPVMAYELPMLWLSSDDPVSGERRRQQHQQMYYVDLVNPHPQASTVSDTTVWDGDDAHPTTANTYNNNNNNNSPGTSIFGYSPANPASQQPNQLKKDP